MSQAHAVPRAAPLAALLLLAGAAPAHAADVFNGRIAFGSYRAEPPAGQPRTSDVFSMNADGSDVRRLTASPDQDRQPDWSPSGRQIAYTIRRPGATVGFELARMTAAGAAARRLTTTPAGQSSSQPSWSPNARAILFRRSGAGNVGTIWQVRPLGLLPRLRATVHKPLYPSWSPAMDRIAFASIRSPTGDTDRGILAVDATGASVTTLFDVPGAYDSAPAWSPDGTRIAFESDADVGGANPERDMELWVMGADGSNPTQLTRNGAHDEGPSWSPDGTLLAYTTGPDDTHGDIAVMTAAGVHERTLTAFAGIDESPDWQAIPAPRSDRRCGDAVATGAGARDVRSAGRGLDCAGALALARRWSPAQRSGRIDGYRVSASDFGGTLRVQLRRGAGPQRRLVAFLHQR